MAFRGFFDMGEAATSAVNWLSMAHNGHPAAAIDPEELFDFQEVRPEVRVGVSGKREIHWPTNNAVYACTDDGLHDLVLLSGVEPNLRWRSFGQAIKTIVDHTGAELLVTLGSSLSMVPHTRAFPVTASAGDAALAHSFGVSRPSYVGPTGLVGSLHHQLGSQGVPMLSVRVDIPHYVPGSPSPKATAALLANLEQLCGIPTAHAGLADEIREWEVRVHRAMADDDEVREYVEELEEQTDANPSITFDGGDITIEIEDFLLGRRRDDGEEPESAS